jgi:hypothetical protein
MGKEQDCDQSWFSEGQPPGLEHLKLWTEKELHDSAHQLATEVQRSFHKGREWETGHKEPWRRWCLYWVVKDWPRRGVRALQTRGTMHTKAQRQQWHCHLPPPVFWMPAVWQAIIGASYTVVQSSTRLCKADIIAPILQMRKLRV